MPYLYTVTFGSGERTQDIEAERHDSGNAGSELTLFDAEGEVVAEFNGLAGWVRREVE